jgi:hypothetical protein
VAARTPGPASSAGSGSPGPDDATLPTHVPPYSSVSRLLRPGPLSWNAPGPSPASGPACTARRRWGRSRMWRTAAPAVTGSKLAGAGGFGRHHCQVCVRRLAAVFILTPDAACRAAARLRASWPSSSAGLGGGEWRAQKRSPPSRRAQAAWVVQGARTCRRRPRGLGFGGSSGVFPDAPQRVARRQVSGHRRKSARVDYGSLLTNPGALGDHSAA